MIAIIDIGGTSIKYGVMNPKTEQHEMMGNLDTNTHESNFKMEKRLEEVIGRIKKEYQISGIALSTAGIVDFETGQIIYANQNIPNYKGTRLKEIIEEKYQLPVTVENDVNAALLGELHFGNFKDVHSALMITVGTGVGGALYLHDNIYHGFSHSAGEIGYATVNNQNIEDVASTTALVRNVQRRLNKADIDGKWIFKQATENNNKVCIEEIDRIITHLIYLISNYVALLNPEVVILGGGIMEQAEYIRPLIDEKFKRVNGNQLVVDSTKIEFASLGNQAGVLGAYAHYKKMLNFP